jgi:CIC family chloride channel protein
MKQGKKTTPTQAVSILIISAAMGCLIGACVIGYESIIAGAQSLLSADQITPIGVACLPIAGMYLTGWIIHHYKITSTAMADEVVEIYHNKERQLPAKILIAKIMASIATLASGCSAGLEGASKWLGAMIAISIQKIALKSSSIRANHPSTLIAGAAAGITAIFSAPLTALAMALESPRRHKIDLRSLPSALAAAGGSFLVCHLLGRINLIFAATRHDTLSYADLPWMISLGVVCGLCAGTFKAMISVTGRFALRIFPRWWTRSLAGGALISTIGATEYFATGRFLVFGSGGMEIQGMLSGSMEAKFLWPLVAGKFLVTIITFAFGGVGGLFLPSATIGAGLGALMAATSGHAAVGTFALLGASAFTGASYSSFVFSLIFVAEAARRPDLMIFAIIVNILAYTASLARLLARSK